MSDIFVSYKREDFDRVERLVEALRANGFDVWWDQDIPPGAPWESAITMALDAARCVLVCWSTASIDPNGGAKVQVEARVANDAGKLIQVKLERVSQPLFFRQWQAADLSTWTGEAGDRAFERVVKAARDIAGGARLGGDHFNEVAAAPPRAGSRRRKALLGAAVAGAAFLCVGGVAATTPDAQILICTLANPDRLCLTPAELDRFDAALADARTRLAQRARFYIHDRRQNFPTVAWAISQLSAPNTDALKADKTAFDARMHDLINPECLCLANGQTPHTITNAWMLITTASFGKAAPDSIMDAILKGQSTEGWWAGALDAADTPDNGATYATAFMILALNRQLDFGVANPDRRARVEEAVRAASGWLVHQASTTSGYLADYPQSLRKLSNPGIDGQTLAALSLTRPDVDLGARAARLAGELGRLPPLWTTASSDVIVTRENGAQYYDDFRHISAAWMVFGAVSGYPDLDPVHRAEVLVALRRVFKRDLTSPDLFEREWVAAEAIFALGESVRRLKIMSEKGLDPAKAGPPPAS